MTSDPGLRFRVVDALADLAEELALSGPLLIGLDDLQWADASSLLTLNALARRAGYLPVGLIACFRPLPRVPELDRLIASLLSAGGRQLSLGGLTEHAVTDLVADMVTAAPGRRLLAGISGAAGNPLFVTEMLGALAQEGMIETSGGRAEVAQVTLPPTLRLTILRRLASCPATPCRRCGPPRSWGPASPLPTCRPRRPGPRWSSSRRWREGSPGGCWRTMATGCGSATT